MLKKEAHIFIAKKKREKLITRSRARVMHTVDGTETKFYCLLVYIERRKIVNPRLIVDTYEHANLVRTICNYEIGT
jgi:hypothetical protein